MFPALALACAKTESLALTRHIGTPNLVVLAEGLGGGVLGR
jgi:hypothetical protein